MIRLVCFLIYRLWRMALEVFGIWAKKKESRLTPTFVNLKSNTMKNTLQRYGFWRYFQMFRL